MTPAIATLFAASLLALPAHAAAACDLAAAPQVPVIKGLDYDHARTALLAAGWQPGHGSQFNDLAGNQSVFRDRGYTELVSCARDTATTCRFLFNGRSGVALHLTTEGEENPLLDSKATVHAVDLACQP